MEARNYLDLKYKIMTKTLKIFLLISFVFLLIIDIYAAEDENKIAILVNDNVITNYDIEQRVKTFAILNQVQITSGNSGGATTVFCSCLGVVETKKRGRDREHLFAFVWSRPSHNRSFSSAGRRSCFIYRAIKGPGVKCSHDCFRNYFTCVYVSAKIKPAWRV